MRATSFMGSTLERMTLPHHRRSILETTWICLRSRISRSCSRYIHARAVRLVVYWLVSDMKLVEGPTRIGQVFVHALDEGSRHVDAYRFDLPGHCVVFLQVPGKAFDNACILAWRDEDHAPAVHVGDQRDIVLPTSGR